MSIARDESLRVSFSDELGIYIVYDDSKDDARFIPPRRVFDDIISYYEMLKELEVEGEDIWRSRDMFYRKHKPGYIYVLRYVNNGVTMVKVGRSSGKSRVKDYRHMELLEILKNVEVSCQACAEKTTLKEFSNGINEHFVLTEDRLADLLKYTENNFECIGYKDPQVVKS